MKHLVSLILFVALVNCNQKSIGQTIPIGKYVGYENIWTTKDPSNYFFPGIYFEKQTDANKTLDHSKVWFHEVTINVSNTCINITKVPVYFVNGTKQYSDSFGGFLSYDCAKIYEYSPSAPATITGKKFVSGHLTTSKYLRKTGSGVPRYLDIIYDLESVTKDELRLRTKFGTIIYKKSN